MAVYHGGFRFLFEFAIAFRVFTDRGFAILCDADSIEMSGANGRYV